MGWVDRTCLLARCRSVQIYDVLVNCNNLFITGVVAGKLTATYGPRPVALLSTVIYVAALVISSYVNKVEVMFVTYGMLHAYEIPTDPTSCTWQGCLLDLRRALQTWPAW